MKSINILKLIEEEEKIEFKPNIEMINPKEVYEYRWDYLDLYVLPILKEKNIKLTKNLAAVFDKTLTNIQYGNFKGFDIPHKFYNIIFQTNEERKKEFANILCNYILNEKHLIDNK